MKRPSFYAAWVFIGAVLAVFVRLGDVLDALSNAAVWITWPVTIWGSITVGALFALLPFLARLIRPRWKNVILTWVDWQYLAAPAVGVLVILWIPHWLPRPAEGIVSTPPTVVRIETPPQEPLPFAVAGKEGFTYYDAKAVKRLPKSAFVDDVLTLLPDVPLQPEYLDIKPGAEFISGMGLRGSVEAFIEMSKPDEPQWLHLVLFRNRDEAGLMPASGVLRDLEGTEQIRYETLCAGYEPALVVTTRVGSGNFLGLRILAWHPRIQEYADLLSVDDLPPEPGSFAEVIKKKYSDPPAAGGDIELPGPGGVFADGYFAFADLNGDRCKELIVTRGWKAIDQRTRYFSLHGASFREAEPGGALYQQFGSVAETVKDQSIWDNSTKRAFYPF